MQTSIYGGQPHDLILIGIGANLPSAFGSPLQTCMAAVESLGEFGVCVSRRSRWYKTAPLPVSDQPWFINGVAAVECDLDPEALLQALHTVEHGFGRERSGIGAARCLDLDLLDYHGVLRDGGAPPELPHPRLADRAFVLLPLAEVAPAWVHPRSGETIAGLIAALDPGQIAEAMD